MLCSRHLRQSATWTWLLVIGATFLPGALVAQDAAPGGLGVVRQIGKPESPTRSGEQLEQITEEVSAKLRCPVCQGMSVADSPSASARAMKDEIEELLAQGYSPAQVNQYFESTYGEFVLLDPKRQGLNWLIWLAPGVIFFGGLAGVIVVMRSRAQDPPVDEDGDLDAYLDRVRARVGTHSTRE